MGYLDGSTITVDALLTDIGRRKLAENGQLGIRFYTFGDTGIDYNLYNADHPSGSNSYGEAITRLPQLEANASNLVSMRYTLTTMPRNTVFIPNIVTEDFTITDTTEQAAIFIRPKTNKFDQAGENYSITIYNAGPFIFERHPTKDRSAHIQHHAGGLLLPDSQYTTVFQFDNVDKDKGLKVKARAIQNDITVTYSVRGHKTDQIAFGSIKVIGTL